MGFLGELFLLIFLIMTLLDDSFHESGSSWEGSSTGLLAGVCILTSSVSDSPVAERSC
jgi:hypothetical protein